ncbi:MAG TPA: SPFH domain-containing protein [Phycisphaerae bacterium]|nr:SPFH domain-containing protein [Phycisphaerae bacterium]HRY70829.1 SPFH domain-containing protein [Phycisphaerae bacterium]HSA28334.1 SPFH domain-containing protein [Phycisphaerae bacterium]
MKRSWPSLISGALLASMLVLYMVTFQVRFSEVAVVRTFGQIKEGGVIKEPGLYWKWPWPIQRVERYDNRIQTASTTGEETPTRDGKNVIITTTVNWRIDDPKQFSIRCKSMKEAENFIKLRVRNDQKTVIGKYDFRNFVSIEPTELKRDAIEAEIAKAVAAVAQELYGLRVERVGIEAFQVPQEVSKSVIEAMKKERQAKAQQYTSEGESEAKQIKDTAESIAGTITTFADRKAAAIVAEGQKRAVEYNRVFREDPELAKWLLQVENIPAALGDRATLVIDQPVFVEVFRDTPAAAPATQPAPDLSGQTAVPAAIPVIVDSK